MLKIYKDLKFWQTANEVTLSVIKLARKLPKDKISYIFVNQIIRSAASVGANIAEGYGRFRGKEYARFIQIALGSANETDYWLSLIKNCFPHYSREVELIIAKNEESIKMLTVTLRKLRSKKY